MTQVDHPDNKPDMEDYLDYKGAIFVTVQIVTPMYASGRIEHLEIFNRPPLFAFEEHGQVCFVGNINGGDSLGFDTQALLMRYLEQEFQTWLVDRDAMSMTDLDNYSAPQSDDPPAEVHPDYEDAEQNLDPTPVDYDSRGQEGHDYDTEDEYNKFGGPIQ